MKLFVLDTRETWRGPLIAAARARGHEARRIQRGTEAAGPGMGFIRVHADPLVLPRNREDDLAMRSCLTMVQDRAQVEVYDDKSEQFRRWGRFMPRTWRIADRDAALDLVKRPEIYGTPEILVSKADEGASSVNVRILKTRAEQIAHVLQVFGAGIQVDHCAGGPGGRHAKSRQRGYVLLQEFVPHECTWRVNVIGRGRAVFRRFNYPDRPVAQTGNVKPVRELDERTAMLLEFVDEILAAIGSKWCALDILWDAEASRYRLLETSLAWPHPGTDRGYPADVPFFGPTQRTWGEMWELLLDECEAGVWT